MAKEEKSKSDGKKSKRLHLHRMVTEQAEDGSFVHHHTYKESKNAPHEMPERRNAATSQSAEEAGQHVADQFGQNEGAPSSGPEEANATEEQGEMPSEQGE